MKKRVAVLGATGSIGKSALEVIARDTSRFEVVLLSSHRHKEELAELGRRWPAAATVLTGEEGGREALLAAIAAAGADITLNGISGAAGLEPSLAAIEVANESSPNQRSSDSVLALANKETMVMAGALVLQKAREKNVNIIPVDSEHSAVFHLLAAHGSDEIQEIILTASGGPFRNFSIKEMEKVSPDAALAHPTWNMGAKITIDSASMANKGLEVIEAARLFNLTPEKIKVVIHPQSIVHSMVRMKDGELYAQLSLPDMRLPIHKALYWPETAPSEWGKLDFGSLTLEFYPPDTEKFPLLALAYHAVKKGGLYPCVYNAANEAAVAAFLAGRIGFLEIARITGYVVDRDWMGKPDTIAAVLEADRQARILAEKEVRK